MWYWLHFVLQSLKQPVLCKANVWRRTVIRPMLIVDFRPEKINGIIRILAFQLNRGYVCCLAFTTGRNVFAIVWKCTFVRNVFASSVLLSTVSLSSLAWGRIYGGVISWIPPSLVRWRCCAGSGSVSRRRVILFGHLCLRSNFTWCCRNRIIRDESGTNPFSW